MGPRAHGQRRDDREAGQPAAGRAAPRAPPGRPGRLGTTGTAGTTGTGGLLARPAGGTTGTAGTTGAAGTTGTAGTTGGPGRRERQGRPARRDDRRGGRPGAPVRRAARARRHTAQRVGGGAARRRGGTGGAAGTTGTGGAAGRGGTGGPRQRGHRRRRRPYVCPLGGALDCSSAGAIRLAPDGQVTDFSALEWGDGTGRWCNVHGLDGAVFGYSGAASNAATAAVDMTLAEPKIQFQVRTRSRRRRPLVRFVRQRDGLQRDPVHRGDHGGQPDRLQLAGGAADAGSAPEQRDRADGRHVRFSDDDLLQLPGGVEPDRPRRDGDALHRAVHDVQHPRNRRSRRARRSSGSSGRSSQRRAAPAPSSCASTTSSSSAWIWLISL